MTDLDQIAALTSRRLAEIVNVVPPATPADVVAFDMDVADSDAAEIALGQYASGTLVGNLRAFADALRRLRRMVRAARGGDATAGGQR